MSHEIETMAYAGETPWHGLGVSIPDDISLDDLLKSAGLDWEVYKNPLHTDIQGLGKVLIPNQFAMVRDKDSKILGIAGDDFKPTQNRQSFEFFRSFLDAAQVKMETAGSLKGGKVIWALANLQNDIILKANGRDDITKAYLLLANSHIPGQALTIKLTTVRVVCNNTLTLSLKMDEKAIGGVFRMTHRTEFDDGMREYARSIVTNAHTCLTNFGQQAKRLIETPMDFDTAIPALAEIFQNEEFKKDNGKQLILTWEDTANTTMKRIRDAYFLQPGRTGKNAWDILQAVTFYNTHQQGRSTDTRLSNSWTGTSSGTNTKVLTSLLKLAA